MVKVTKHEYSKTKEGVMTHFYRLESGNISIDVCDYGATILSIKTPDKNGNIHDVVLGYDTIQEYQENSGYFGATVGRFANRIAKGEFLIDGNKYTLAKNDGGKNHLHGGVEGFDKKIFFCEEIKDGVQMMLISEDMEEGYPGKLNLTVKFILLPNGTLIIGYEAVSNKDTIINLTNHSYFNLKGHSNGTILDHKISIQADKYLKLNDESIPTGEIAKVDGTSFDLRTSQILGDHIKDDTNCEDIKVAGGYDHNFCLNNVDTTLKTVAILENEESGRRLTLSTDLPGVQLYTANRLGAVKGKDGATYSNHSALCLETQFYPDSPNHTKFTSCALGAGEKFVTTTTFKFDII